MPEPAPCPPGQGIVATPTPLQATPFQPALGGSEEGQDAPTVPDTAPGKVGPGRDRRTSRAGEDTARAMEAVSVEGGWQPCNESKPEYISVPSWHRYTFPCVPRAPLHLTWLRMAWGPCGRAGAGAAGTSASPRAAGRAHAVLPAAAPACG